MENDIKLQNIQSKLNTLEKEKAVAEGRAATITQQRDKLIIDLKQYNIETPQQLTDAIDTLDVDIAGLEKEIDSLISTLPEEVRNRINEQQISNSFE